MSLKSELQKLLVKYKNTKNADGIPINYNTLKNWYKSLDSGGGMPSYENVEIKTFEKKWTSSEVLEAHVIAHATAGGEGVNWAALEVIPGIPGKIILLENLNLIAVTGDWSLSSGNATTLDTLVYSGKPGLNADTSLGMTDGFFGNFLPVPWDQKEMYQSMIRGDSNQWLGAANYSFVVGRGIWAGEFNKPAAPPDYTVVSEGYTIAVGTYIVADAPDNW